MITRVIVNPDDSPLRFQRSDDGYFDATALLNEFNLLSSNKPRKMEDFKKLKETKELCDYLVANEGVNKSPIISSLKGTWMHPFVFIDFAMWLSVETKVRVLKWVLDGLMELRDNSGDSFKSMNAALLENYPNHANATNYMRIANAISKACGVYELGADKWQLATKEQIEMRDRIQSRIVTYADVVDNVEDCINRAIQKELNVKI
jgi:hypothetical protein